MDKVYKFYDRHASPNIPLEEYFRRYGESLEQFARRKTANSREKNLFLLMDADISQTRTHLMTHYCSVDNLTLPIEVSTVGTAEKPEKPEKHGYIDIPERIVQSTCLETIKVLKTLPTDVFLKPKYYNSGIPIKYEENSELSDDDDDDNDDNDNVLPNKDFLIYVRVYEPFNSQTTYRTISQNPPFLKLRNVVSILGRQSLYELRRKILCRSDLSIGTEVSENPDRKPGPMAKDVYKSGFFYIGDTFYNDTSAANNVDYSAVILKWSETRDIGPFKTASMDTRMNSLCVKFGFPWLYQHQGCCEHVIVLSDARLIADTDVSALSAYPRIERIRSVVGKNCIMCGMLNVRWILTDHDRIPHDTSYFCHKCFVSYNYVNGKKIGNFKAYNYPCVTKLMPGRGTSRTSHTDPR